MNFSIEIWLKVGEHEYIYITEVTFYQKLFRFKMATKTFFFFFFFFFWISRNNTDLC